MRKNKTNIVKLRDIAIFINGQSPESVYYTSDSSFTPFLQGSKTFGRLYPKIEVFTSKNTKVSEFGDILMSVRAPVGEINISDKNICIGRGLGILRAKNVSSQELYFILKYNIKKIISLGTGSTFSSITSSDIDSMDFFIPKDGIKKISEFLWKIESLIELNNKINDNLVNLQ